MHVSHRLRGPMAGALAGGGDPGSSPLYVFGPFLKLIAASGVGAVSFGVPLWLVVVTVIAVSLMYRRVMRWITDGSGGSGLCEEEFGSWAVKLNAGITAIEYTLTFLVSLAALVTFVADRAPALGGRWTRTALAVALSAVTAWVVNRGPRTASRVFGPATGAVLVLLWVLVVATVASRGLHVPSFDLAAFSGANLHVTLGGYVRLLALMTGIEVFANLVAAYEGPPAERARQAFSSLMIVMGTTLTTMIVVGPAIWALSDPHREDVSVFTQTMDRLLPQPLPWVGTLVGIVVLLSAAAASAQGLQNLALGLRYRHYVPASFGQRNRYDVADRPVWIQLAVVAGCYVAFGTHEETYLALYAAGVFVLLGLTGWAAVKRLRRELGERPDRATAGVLVGSALAAFLTTVAAVLIFVERFSEGAWAYGLMVPALYLVFDRYRKKLGPPTPIEAHLGRVLGEQKTFLPAPDVLWPRSVLIVVDGTPEGEVAVVAGVGLAGQYDAPPHACLLGPPDRTGASAYADALGAMALGGRLDGTVVRAEAPEDLQRVVRELDSDLIVTSIDPAHVRSLAPALRVPMLVVRPRSPAALRHTLMRRVVVGLDGSPSSEQAIPFVRLMLVRGARVTLALVPDGDEGQDLLQQYATRIAELLRRDGEVELVMSGSGPARTLVELAAEREADLVVVGTHGRGGLDRAERIPLGSVPNRLMTELECPLLLVPARLSEASRVPPPAQMRSFPLPGGRSALDGD